MTIAVDWDVKNQTKQIKKIGYESYGAYKDLPLISVQGLYLKLKAIDNNHFCM